MTNLAKVNYKIMIFSMTNQNNNDFFKSAHSFSPLRVNNPCFSLFYYLLSNLNYLLFAFMT